MIFGYIGFVLLILSYCEIISFTMIIEVSAIVLTVLGSVEFAIGFKTGGIFSEMECSYITALIGNIVFLVKCIPILT